MFKTSVWAAIGLMVPFAAAAESEVVIAGRDPPQAMARYGDFGRSPTGGDCGLVRGSAPEVTVTGPCGKLGVAAGGPAADYGAPVPSPARAGLLVVSGARRYPVNTRIISTTFWVGEIFNPKLPDGSQVCSTYDSKWAYHWSGVNKGKVPRDARACPGAIKGGCDGVTNQSGKTCETQARTAKNDYFPTSVPKPKENPFYLDLPYDDLNDPVGFANRCADIPWAKDAGYAGHCTDKRFSYMKNRWVEITGPNGRVCYGQIEDAGPSHGKLYHDATYVFGKTDARPMQTHFNHAGMDVSPALNGCLGYAELNGDHDKITWKFIDTASVPKGPWTIVVTRSGVTL